MKTNLILFIAFVLCLKFSEPGGGFFRGGILLAASLLLFIYLLMAAYDILFVAPRMSHDDGELPPELDEEEAKNFAPSGGGFTPKKYLGEIDEGAELLDEFDRTTRSAPPSFSGATTTASGGDDFFAPGPRR
jgi:hypothetical protein